MNGFLLVALGGAIGACLRYGVSLAAMSQAGVSGAWATLSVNVVGCAVMGGLTAWLAARNPASGDVVWMFLGIGVLGAFTTFSSFSKDAFSLYLNGETVRASAYVLANMAGSLLAFAIALSLTRKLLA